MIKIGTVNGDVIETGGIKNVTNHYYGSEHGLEHHEKRNTRVKESSQSLTNVMNITLSETRQSIFNQLLDYPDKGEWARGITAEDIKTMLKAIMGLSEKTLPDEDAEMSETLCHLLENGRGDRVKIVWQNIVGYLDDKKLFQQKGSPALNKDFFGNEENYSNIDKGRPSRDNMSSGFRDLLPLLDAYVPTIG